MVVESTDSANTHQPSKLRVPGSIPGAPTTKPLKTHGEEQPPLEQVEEEPSANLGLSGPKLRNNCGSQPPPASGWRSMASAPRDGSNFCGVVAPYRVVRIGCICADGEHFRGDDGGLYRVVEMLAWAPIPEWTGEVAE